MDFIEAADHFRACVRALHGTRQSLGHAERHVIEGLPGDPRQAALAELEISRIAQKIDELMHAYDLMRRKLGYAPRYAHFLENRRVAR